MLGCKVCCSCDELIRTNVKNLLHIRAHEEAHTEGGVVCVHCLDDSITERIVDVGPKWGKDRCRLVSGYGSIRREEDSI